MRSYLNACIERSEYWFLLSSSTCCMYTDACTLFVSLLCACVCVCGEGGGGLCCVVEKINERGGQGNYLVILIDDMRQFSMMMYATVQPSRI
jgi:hypothetical protein